MVTEPLGWDETDHAHELRRTEIVNTALRILNEVGLEKLSVRGVAQELGMHPPGLYWYIESKQDLIDRMAAAILDEGYRGLQKIGDGEPWSAWLITLALQARATLLRYRDGARVIASAYLFRTNGITPWIEMMLEALAGVGFTRAHAMRGVLTILHYTTGVVLDEQLSPPVPQPVPRPVPPSHRANRTKPLVKGPPVPCSAGRESPTLGPVIDATRWPRTAEAMRTMFQKHFRDVASFRERQFVLGLELIVAGMQGQREMTVSV